MSQTGTVTRNAIADEVRALLGRRRLSASKLAQQLGWTQAYISRRLVGDQAFDTDDLEQIARALEVKMVDLLPYEERTPSMRSYLDPTPVAPPRVPAPRGPHRPVDNRPGGHPQARSARPGINRTAPTGR